MLRAHPAVRPDDRLAMQRTRLAVLLGFFLAGCPAAAPDSGRFAGDAAASLQDSNPAASDSAAPTDDTATSQPDTSVAPGADAAASDVGGPDAGGAKGVCANGIGLYAKSFSTGGGEAAYASVLLADGSALLVGDSGTLNKTDMLALRISAVGTTLWSQTYGGADEDHGSGALALTDGFAVVGTTRSKGAGYGDGWLVRTDAKGVLLWDKTYGGSGDDALYGIAPAGDGFVLAGMNRSLGGGLDDGWLVRTDASGGVLWENKYGGSSIDSFAAVVALPSGGFAAAGVNNSIASQGSDAWLVFVDGKGKQGSEKVFGLGENDDAKALTRLPDGGFALTGVASQNGNPQLGVIRTGADGGLLWKDVVGGNQSEEGHGITAFPDGSLAVVGVTDSPNASGSSSGEDGWLLRYDAWGNRLWDLRFGGGGNEWLYAVQAMADGGLLLAGRLYDQSTSDNAWFLRMDAWGHTDCSKAGACKTKAAGDCDDGNACTIDTCDNIDGCTHAALPVGAACGSGAVCGTTSCTSN